MLKQEFLDRIKQYPDLDYEKFVSSYSLSPQKAVQVHKVSKDALPFLKSKLPFGDNLYFVENVKLGKTYYHHAGLVYVQEPSAMAVVESLKLKDDYKVLDLCASPGGKSCQIASKLSNGLLISNEIVSSRSQILLQNIVRMGFTNTIVTNSSPDSFAKTLDNYFDVIFVDAPCSGEGMFRKDETACMEWSVSHVNSCKTRQLNILNSIEPCVKAGGYLVYSTCTFSMEENEQVVQQFLTTHTTYKLVDVTKDIKTVSVPGYNGLSKTRRFYPHIFGEGQYVAVLQKVEQSNPATSKHKFSLINSKQRQILNKFVQANMASLNGEIVAVNNRLYLLPPNCPNLSGIKIVCAGVYLGEIVNDRFMPSHHLFVTKSSLFTHKYVLRNEEQANQYLMGYEFENNDTFNGYGVVMYNNVVLGGYKQSGDRVKNLYPKELRNK